MDTRSTIWFDDLRVTDRPLVGGKCANLGELIAAGIPVPRGFAVTVAAWDEFTRAGDLVQRIRHGLIDGVDVGDSAALRAVQAEASHIIHDALMPEPVEREIREGYAELCRRSGRVDVPVAVRSSAVAEDGDASSFAGQQETFLWVRGADDVLDAVRDCWASLFTPQAVAYRARLDEDARSEAVKLSVAVQEMVDAEVAGVAFTVSPTTGDPSVMAINASWGLGEAVVSGEVTPDEYWLSKIGPELTRSTVSRKERRCVPATEGKGTIMEAIPEDLVDMPCLTDEQVRELAEIAIRVERHYGAAQDIEWALARDAEGSRFLLLQARPETVNSTKKQPAPPTSATSWLSTIQGIGAQTARGRS